MGKTGALFCHSADKDAGALRLAKNVFATHVYVCIMLITVAETRLMTKGLNFTNHTPCDVKMRFAVS
jgi:hypothetical protein